MTSVLAETSDDIESTVGIRLLLGVARLGEADLAAWWSSQGLNPATRFALAGFRRTGSIVGAELALLSAVRRHHQVLPRLNAVHLFSPRLPFARWTQAHLAELKSIGTSELIDELRTWTTVEDAGQRLTDWIDAVTPAMAIGATVTPHELDSPETRVSLLAQLAARYVDQAGRAGQLDIPYVDLAT